ncbi:hypothetical protein ACFQ1S_23460, partial [Kibdelosporangium lantanae]
PSPDRGSGVGRVDHGPDVVLSLAGKGVAWAQLAAYLIAPLIGGLVAAFLHDLITRRVPAQTVTTNKV